jgi:hypothetical protein
LALQPLYTLMCCKVCSAITLQTNPQTSHLHQEVSKIFNFQSSVLNQPFFLSSSFVSFGIFFLPYDSFARFARGSTWILDILWRHLWSIIGQTIKNYDRFVKLNCACQMVSPLSQHFQKQRKLTWLFLLNVKIVWQGFLYDINSIFVPFILSSFLCSDPLLTYILR